MSYLFIDLEQIQTAFTGNLFWSLDKFNLAAFHRKDYLDPAKKELFRVSVCITVPPT